MEIDNHDELPESTPDLKEWPTPPPVKAQAVEVDGIELPDVPHGSKSFEWKLGDVDIQVTRLKTTDAFAASKLLLKYLDGFRKAYATPDGAAIHSEDRAVKAEASFSVIGRVVELLDEDDLTSLAARVLGQPKEMIGQAPLEDVLTAMCGAFDLNRLPHLLRTLRVLGAKAGVNF